MGLLRRVEIDILISTRLPRGVLIHIQDRGAQVTFWVKNLSKSYSFESANYATTFLGS